MENRKSLAYHLSAFDIPIEEVEPHIFVDDPGAALLLVGTFSQGMATPTSDIDFLLVYPEDCFVNGLSERRSGECRDVFPVREGDSSFLRDNLLVINRKSKAKKKVQTCVARADYIRERQDLILARNQSYRNRVAGDGAGLQRRGRTMDWTSQFLIHRIYTGLPLINESAVSNIRDRAPIEEFADNVAIRESSSIYDCISDLNGQMLSRGGADRETVVVIYHRIFIHLLGVLLASVNEISPQEKWYFRLLKKNREKIGSKLVDEIIFRFSRIDEDVDNDPLSIIAFVKEVVSGLGNVRPLVAAEFRDWNAEASYAAHSIPSSR